MEGHALGRPFLSDGDGQEWPSDNGIDSAGPFSHSPVPRPAPRARLGENTANLHGFFMICFTGSPPEALSDCRPMREEEGSRMRDRAGEERRLQANGWFPIIPLESGWSISDNISFVGRPEGGGPGEPGGTRAMGVCEPGQGGNAAAISNTFMCLGEPPRLSRPSAAGDLKRDRGRSRPRLKDG